MKVLYLTPWYPSERDEMLGLFVQKHVESVRAQGVDVRVIFSQGWRDMWRQWRELQREWGLPDVVQLNVIQKQGLLALWLKRKYGIPYVIIEHWSGYLPENGQFMRMSWWKKRLMQIVCKNASVVLPVSRPLQRAMQHCGLQAREWGIIDNVVDEFFFEKVESGKRKVEGEKRTLLYVSCFDERAKNVKALVRAAKQLADRCQDWRLVLIGTGVDYADVRAYAESLHFPEGLLLWTGELTPREVAEWLHRSDAFVLSSRYETYGVVLAEAVAAGVPILSTPVGIAEDMHASLIPQEDANNHPDKFAEQIESVLFAAGQTKPSVDANRFTPQAVGQKLKQIYEQTKGQ